MNVTNHTSIARKLRANQTLAETKVWNIIRAKQISGIKFKRQQPIGNYIVDFVSFEKMLIIEIDGGQHNEEANAKQDKKRTDYFKSLGYKVLRFWNNDVLNNLGGVYEEILNSLPSL